MSRAQESAEEVPWKVRQLGTTAWQSLRLGIDCASAPLNLVELAPTNTYTDPHRFRNLVPFLIHTFCHIQLAMWLLQCLQSEACEGVHVKVSHNPATRIQGYVGDSNEYVRQVNLIKLAVSEQAAISGLKYCGAQQSDAHSKNCLPS